jgi:hypothetical protein
MVAQTGPNSRHNESDLGYVSVRVSGNELSRDWQSSTTILPIRSERRGDSNRGDCASVAQSSFTGRISKVFTPSFENRFPAVPLRDVAIDDSNGFYYRNAVAPVNNIVNTDKHSVFKRQSTQRSIALRHPVHKL